jgi:hypothetical protein
MSDSKSSSSSAKSIDTVLESTRFDWYAIRDPVGSDTTDREPSLLLLSERCNDSDGVTEVDEVDEVADKAGATKD